MTAEPKTRAVLRVVEPIGVLEGAGVRLKRTIASRALDYLDPFLLLDHFGSDNPDDYLAGFPWHPHRGIETVTYMLAGEVNHRDSIGHAGTIGAGDVQWMTAGGEIMHEEMPQPKEGKMAGFQLWVCERKEHKPFVLTTSILIRIGARVHRINPSSLRCVPGDATCIASTTVSASAHRNT